jgi:hypothetical protein
MRYAQGRDVDQWQSSELDQNDALNAKIMEVWKVAEPTFARTCQEWNTHLEAWSLIVEVARQQFGNRWTIKLMAAAAAGIRSPSEKGGGGADLFDDDQPLCARSRYARLRAGNESWWARILETDRGEQRLHALLLCLAWASERTILRLAPRLSELLESLETTEWNALYDGLEDVLVGAPDREPDKDATKVDVGSISARLGAAMIHRPGRSRIIGTIYSSTVRSQNGNDSRIFQAFLRYAEASIISGSADRLDLEFVQRAHKSSSAFDRYRSRRYMSSEIRTEFAREICNAPSAFPVTLFFAAERHLHGLMSSRISPVGDTAKRENWFEDHT